LLTVEWPERSPVDPTVDEVETNPCSIVAADGREEDVEEVPTDLLDGITFAALGVVSLEVRDLDTLDRGAHARALAGEGKEGRSTAFGGHPSAPSGSR
jgi:hypothetical protein